MSLNTEACASNNPQENDPNEVDELDGQPKKWVFSNSAVVLGGEPWLDCEQKAPHKSRSFRNSEGDGFFPSWQSVIDG